MATTAYDRIEPGVTWDPSTCTLFIEPHRVMARLGTRYGTTPALVFCNVVATWERAYPDRRPRFITWVKPGTHLPAPGKADNGKAS